MHKLEITILAFMIGIGVGNFIGWNIIKLKMEQGAIEAGVAKFVCNEKTGERTFVYKNNTNF